MHGGGSVDVQPVSARLLRLHADCNGECVVRIGQFYYPRWRVRVVPAGTAIPLAGGPLGLMELTLPAGRVEAEVELPPTTAEWLGSAVSVVTMVLVSAIALSGVYSRRRRTHPTDATSVP